MADGTKAYITSIGGYVFDAYISIKHNSRLNITSHKVETGASISDHAYLEPAEITFDIEVSGAKQNSTNRKISRFDEGSSSDRTVNAYKILKNAQEDRTFLTVITKYETYENMLVSELSVEEEADSFGILRATVTLKQVLLATSQKVKITAKANTISETIVSEEPQVTNETNSGVVSPLPTTFEDNNDLLGMYISDAGDSIGILGSD